MRKPQPEETAMRMCMAIALTGLVTLGACASSGSATDPGAVACRTGAASTLVGKVAPDDATILGRTGGTIVRRIAPGDPTTKDYRIERVTVTIAEGKVVAASCG
jgi:hypothetical protein